MDNYETLIESIEDILNDIYEKETEYQYSDDNIENYIECMVSGGSFGDYYTLEDMARNANNERLQDFIDNTDIDEKTILDVIADTHTTDYNIGYATALNELLSAPLGEIEVDLEEYTFHCNNHEDNTERNTLLQYYLDNLELLDDDVNTDFYVSGNYGYLNMTDTRASVIFNEEEFFKHPKITA